MLNINYYISKFGYILIFFAIVIMTVLSLYMGIAGKEWSWLILSAITGACFIAYFILEKHYFNTKIIDNQSVNNIAYRILHSNQLYYIYSSVYFALIIIGLLSLHHMTYRNEVYIAVIILLIVTIIISILSANTSIKRIFELIKTLVLSLFVSLASFKIYYWTGKDTWGHAYFNEMISNVGFLPPTLGKEIDYPVQHILVSSTSVFVDVDVRIATIISILLSSVIISLIIYAIACKLMDKKCALLALLIYNLSVNIIQWRVWGQTTTYASVLFLVLVFVLLRYLSHSNKGGYKYLILYIFLSTLIVMGHAFSSFIILFIICFLLPGYYLYSNVSNTNNFPIKSLLVVAITFVIIMLIYWSFSISGWGLQSIVHHLNTELFTEIASDSSGSLSLVEKYIDISPPTAFENLFRQIPMTILYSLCPVVIMSCILIKHSRTKNDTYLKNDRMWLVCIPFFACLIMLFITCISGVGMGSRFGIYTIVFSSIIIAYIIYYYVTSSKKTVSLKLIISIVIILSLILVPNVLHPAINDDNHLWLKNSYSAASLTNMEYAGISTIIQYIPLNKDKTLQTDYDATSPVSYIWSKYYNRDTSHVVLSYSEERVVQAPWGVFQDDDSTYLILRDVLKLVPTRSQHHNIMKLKQSDYDEIDRLNEIYSNIDIKLYQY